MIRGRLALFADFNSRGWAWPGLNQTRGCLAQAFAWAGILTSPLSTTLVRATTTEAAPPFAIFERWGTTALDSPLVGHDKSQITR
jgi:hypothetical protein